MDARRQLGFQIEQNIAANERSLHAARTQARRLDGNALAQFKAADDAVRLAQQRLQRSLSAAQQATVDQWDRARATLAADYEAYTHAVTQLQRIAISGSADGTAPFRTR